MNTLSKEPHLVRYSGLRVDPKYAQMQREHAARNLIQAAPGLVSVLLNDQFSVDDALRVAVKDDIQFWSAWLHSGEILLCYPGGLPVEPRYILAAYTLSGVIPGRHAILTGYVLPQVRENPYMKRVLQEVINYAFAPTPEGLGLLKLKAGIPVRDAYTAGALRAAGFQIQGMSVLDASYHGQLSDIVFCELMNPAIFKEAEVISGDNELLVPVRDAESSALGGEPIHDERPTADNDAGGGQPDTVHDGVSPELLPTGDVEPSGVPTGARWRSDAIGVRRESKLDGAQESNASGNDTGGTGGNERASRPSKTRRKQPVAGGRRKAKGD
jgi:RimJ/RimL family protein N-acetyltransferase